jgi:hypothetical protein
VRHWIVILALAFATLGAISIRVVVEGRAVLADADAARAAGDLELAIRKYEQAARWYFPLAPHVDESYGRLRAIASDPAQPTAALPAWRAIRSAALATRSLWTPHADDLADANAAIARLSSVEPGAATTDVAWHAERLQRSERPSIPAAVLAGLGIVILLGGVIGLVRRGLDEAGRLVRRPALLSAAAIVVGVASWLAGLYNA